MKRRDFNDDSYNQKPASSFWSKVFRRVDGAVNVGNLTAFFVFLATFATTLSYLFGDILAYGDAESHINIAKRVINSLTPGFAQLGGIWLPLQHMMMIPLVWYDPLWHTGFAGAIVSGASYVVSSVVLYLLIYTITQRKSAALVGASVFFLNPNILYMQSTPMTELPLIMFFLLSSYFFIRYIREKTLSMLLMAGLFAFCASLTRYDGWFLVLFESLVTILVGLRQYKSVDKTLGDTLIFSFLAFFGIGIWLMWGWLILGDPLYFTDSVYSAHAQQQNWLLKHELPAYKNMFLSVAYYGVTAMSNIGVISTILACIGLLIYFFSRKEKGRYAIALILFVPFIFNVASLYLGQDVIFIPQLTPKTFEWTLFNVRYGILMVPVAAFFVGYLFSKTKVFIKCILIIFLCMQITLSLPFVTPIITLKDGTQGLSSAKNPDAQQWLKKHYTNGLVLIDDYARSVSIIKSGIPMQNVIYVGTKPYWNDSLKQPEKYANWIVMQKNDAVWQGIYANNAKRAELYKYFTKEYTSNDILIFKKNTS